MIDHAPTSARMELQAATAEAHERLHHVPVFASLAAGSLDRGGYAGLLARLHGFHCPMEAAIARGLEADPIGRRLKGWRRAHLLRSDLIHLGMDDAAIDRLPRAAVPSDAVSPATAMGFLYVVEGSTLGGRQLARGLDGLLPKGVPDGRSFLSAGADRNHVRWRDVCAAVEAHGADWHGRVEMVAAAVEAFRRFELWFEPDVTEF